MPDGEFARKLARRAAYMHGLDGSEALILCMSTMWAIEMVFLPAHNTSDPVARALHDLAPSIPVQVHGWLLLISCSTHVWASMRKLPDVRCACIAAEMVFFIFAYWSIVFTHQYLPGLFTLPVFILTCALNFASLLKPMEEWKWVLALKSGG